jgi:actin-related protein
MMTLEERAKAMDKITIEVKDIVFDYFNIITKEYEMAYEKLRSNEEYKQQLQDIKDQIDNEFITKKFDLPPTLTKDKANELVKRKAVTVQSLIKNYSG